MACAKKASKAAKSSASSKVTNSSTDIVDQLLAKVNAMADFLQVKIAADLLPFDVSQVVSRVPITAASWGLIELRTWNPTPVGYAVLLALIVVCYKKLYLWSYGIVFLLFSGESKGLKKCFDSQQLLPHPDGKQQKIVIFIRHGESDWNQIFNKNKLLLLPRLILGLIREACCFMFDDSVFIDSGLNREGVQQAKDLQRHLWPPTARAPKGNNELEKQLFAALRGDEGAMSSVLVCSNLRRAVQTGCIALWPRLQKQKSQKIQLHAALQEVTRNVDTNSLLTEQGQLPETGLIEKYCPAFDAKKHLDVHSNRTVNKKLSRRALGSLEEFAGWCFSREEDVIIVSAGHSIWFKRFFEVFLPGKDDKNHYAKKKKMKNCSVVAFNLTKGVRSRQSQEEGYRIEKDSITSLYLGFDKHKEGTPNRLQLPTKTDDDATLAAEESKRCVIS